MSVIKVNGEPSRYTRRYRATNSSRPESPERKAEICGVQKRPSSTPTALHSSQARQERLRHLSARSGSSFPLSMEMQEAEPMPNMPLTAVKQSVIGIIRFMAPSASSPRMLLTMIESTIRLSEMDAAMSTDGKKNSMNFPPTSAPLRLSLSSRQCSILCPFSQSNLHL